MSYKVVESAVTIIMTAFYDCLFAEGRTVLSAAYECRAKLRAHPLRTTGLFGLELPLQDDIIPVLYSTSGQQHNHNLSFRRVSQYSPSSAGTPDIYGRGLDMLKVENWMLRHKVVVIQGPHGIGKQHLLHQLSAWFKESRLLDTIFDLNCSDISTPQEADEAVHRVKLDTWLTTRSSEEALSPQENDVDENDPSKRSMLILRNLDEEQDWMIELCTKFAAATKSNETISSYILISSTARQDGLCKKLKTENGLDARTYGLGALDLSAATKYMVFLRGKPSSLEKTEEVNTYSSLWYEHSTLSLLQRNPLAMKVVIPLMQNGDPQVAYWKLKTMHFDLDWSVQGLKLLVKQWQRLVKNHPCFLAACLPFAKCVPQDFLESVNVPDLSLALTDLQASGCGNLLQDANHSRLDLHPLFAQYIRSQPRFHHDEQSSWRNAAAYYHRHSVQWIRTWLYLPSRGITEAKVAKGFIATEWDNLTSVLEHCIPALKENTKDSADFDVIWLACSLQAFAQNMPLHTVDMFADLTKLAMRAIIPEFIPTSNVAIKVLVDAGIKKCAARVTDLQLIRLTLFAQFLIQYYYDSSIHIASIYQDFLDSLYDSVPESRIRRSKSLFDVAKAVSFLTMSELAVEAGRVPKTKLWPWCAFASDWPLPSEFRDFADVWGQTHAFRLLGMELDFPETLQNLEARINSQERGATTDLSPTLQALRPYVDVYHVLNDPRAQGKRQLLERNLKDALTTFDSRSQLGIYGYLVDVCAPAFTPRVLI